MNVQAISYASVATRPVIGKKANFNARQDDLSAYKNYNGPTPPAIEEHKYQLSLQVNELIEKGKLQQAALLKLEIARICREQGKYEDADKLSEGARQLLLEA